MYKSLEESLLDLEKQGQLVRIKEEVDPYLEMAALHLKVHEAGGPALLFEHIRGTRYRAVSNLFGTMERSTWLFRHTLDHVKKVVSLRKNPVQALKQPFKHVRAGWAASKALPKRKRDGVPGTFEEISISDLPFIHHWPDDGGAFITLPQVYTEDPTHPGIMHANLGMYRIQLNGNDYRLNEEIGLHYQIHRGIGVHQTKAKQMKKPLKVSIFVGGPPAHTLSAVMPLPEGMSELTFAGLLGGRRFVYSYAEGYCISHDADFVILGEVDHDEVKPEGPFGDHLGYYSLIHPFPVMRVHKVLAKKKAIWPFTVVGRPPQEDTMFGELIHEMTGEGVRQEIPGVKGVHAVDAAGVHPLLFAIGSERYTPYQQVKQPTELLTQANHILGTGQLSLAKYLFITAEEQGSLNIYDERAFLTYMLERLDLERDLHFYTNTSIDTLDYSGTGLNTGSKLVLAAYGERKRELCQEVPSSLRGLRPVRGAKWVMPGVVAFETGVFRTYDDAAREMAELDEALRTFDDLETCPLLVLCDDAGFVSESMRNFMWVTFTRSNPSHDVYGVNSRVEHKHWGCTTMIIDARLKPHHAPPLVSSPRCRKTIGTVF